MQLIFTDAIMQLIHRYRIVLRGSYEDKILYLARKTFWAFDLTMPF